MDVIMGDGVADGVAETSGVASGVGEVLRMVF